MIEVGKLYRVRGTIPVRTDNGYLMAAYAYQPRFSFHQKDTLANPQPLVKNETIVLVVDIPKEPFLKQGGVHVLLEDKVHYMLVFNLVAL